VVSGLVHREGVKTWVKLRVWCSAWAMERRKEGRKEGRKADIRCRLAQDVKNSHQFPIHHSHFLPSPPPDPPPSRYPVSTRSPILGSSPIFHRPPGFVGRILPDLVLGKTKKPRILSGVSVFFQNYFPKPWRGIFLV